MWAYSPKIAKVGNIWYKFAKKRYTPYAIFVKFGLGRESQVCTLIPNFTILAFKKVGLQPQKSRKKVIFGINLPPLEILGAHRQS